jgi:hypothetical protein
MIRLALLIFFIVTLITDTTLTMYPNPVRVNTHFTITTKADELLPYVDIYNSSSQLVYERYIGTGLKTVTINVTGLHPGYYVVCVKNYKGVIQ